MVQFFVQAGYKAEALAALAKNPQNRVEAIRQVIEKLGGKLESGGLAFGGNDLELIAICQMPDHVSAAAFTVALAAGGSVTSIKTTPLITGAQGLEALTKAAQAGYRPAGL